MIELYFWTTPNGMKPLIFLEETGIEHDIRPVNISNNTHPNAQISARLSTGFPRACSGDM